MIRPIIPVALLIPTDFKHNPFILCSINPNTCSTLALIFDFFVSLAFDLIKVFLSEKIFWISEFRKRKIKASSTRHKGGSAVELIIHGPPSLTSNSCLWRMLENVPEPMSSVDSRSNSMLCSRTKQRALAAVMNVFRLIDGHILVCRYWMPVVLGARK